VEAFIMSKQEPPSKSAIYHAIMGNMYYGRDYDHTYLYMVYLNFMALDAFATCGPALTENTIKRYVAGWVAEDKLGRKRVGNEVTFYKLPPPELKVLTARECVDGLINCFKEWMVKWKS
jgi:hypothetical protein